MQNTFVKYDLGKIAIILNNVMHISSKVMNIPSFYGKSAL